MAQLLKNGVTVTVRLGPFLSKTDGVTEQTALTPVVEVSKNHAAFGARNSATAIAHDSNGWYAVELNGTDTGTNGPLLVKSDDSTTYLPVWREFLVVPANTFDAIVSDSGTGLRGNMTGLNGVTTSASNLQYAASAMKRCTVTNAGFAPTTTQFETADVTEATADHYVGRAILWLTGALANAGADSQTCYITAYSLVSGRGRFTVTTMTDAPANTDTFIIV